MRWNLDPETGFAPGVGPYVAAVPADHWERAREGQWFAVADPEMPVWLRLEVVDDKIAVTGLTVLTAEPLSTTMLREIPLQRLLEVVAQMADGATMMLPPEQRAKWSLRWQAQGVDGVVTGTRRETTTSRRPGRRGHSEEKYVEVAELYRRALRTHPRAPMKHAADAAGYSVAQMARLVSKARDRGLLDEEAGQ